MPQPIAPDPDPRPWMRRDLTIKQVKPIKTIEMKGPKGNTMIVNETDQSKWANRGWKPTDRESPQNAISFGSLHVDPDAPQSGEV